MASAGAWLGAAHPGSRSLANPDHRQEPEKEFSWLMAKESMSSSEESELPNKGRGKGTVYPHCLSPEIVTTPGAGERVFGAQDPLKSVKRD